MASRIYYRVQPKGLEVIGHTSWMTGDCEEEDKLDDGYVFAFDWPHETLLLDLGGIPEEYGDEVVAILADPEDSYDPGDYEGTAIYPREVLARFAFPEWLAFLRGVLRSTVEFVSDDDDLRGWALNDWKPEIEAALMERVAA